MRLRGYIHYSADEFPTYFDLHQTRVLYWMTITISHKMHAVKSSSGGHEFSSQAGQTLDYNVKDPGIILLQ